MALQYKVPSNVDVEDKIFGPLSIRQFIWLVIGGFLLFVFYLLFAKTSFFLFFILGLPIAAVFGALAFLRINERPFELFVTSSARSFLRPRARIWMRTDEPDIQTESPAPEMEVAPAFKPGVEQVRSQLEELTMVVDTQGWGRQSEAESSGFLAGGRIVSEPEVGRHGWTEPEPVDPAERGSTGGELDKILEEAGRAALAKQSALRAAAKHAEIRPDPAHLAYEQESTQVRPPVARYASPEEMRAALQAFNSHDPSVEGGVA